MTENKHQTDQDFRVLVTGFTPFPGAPENPTSVLVEDIAAGSVAMPLGVSCVSQLLPTEYTKSVEVLGEALQRVRPHLLLEFGLSAKAGGIMLERVARNEMTSETPDNTGFKGEGGLIDPSAHATYQTGLPLDPIYTALKKADLPVFYSDSAGAYVCNHLLFRTLQMPHGTRPAMAGFIHIPYLQDQHERLVGQGRIEKELKFVSRKQLHEALPILIATARDETTQA